MAKARPLKGWTRLSAGRYRNPAGEEVSRRQYDNARLRALGFRSRAEKESISSDRKLAHFIGLIADEEDRSEWSVRRDPAFQRAALGAHRSRMGRTGPERERGPEGGAAKILTRAGLRSPDATNRIGEGYERKRRRRR